jgi:hypothetical protein
VDAITERNAGAKNRGSQSSLKVREPLDASSTPTGTRHTGAYTAQQIRRQTRIDAWRQSLFLPRDRTQVPGSLATIRRYEVIEDMRGAGAGVLASLAGCRVSSSPYHAGRAHSCRKGTRPGGRPI